MGDSWWKFIVVFNISNVSKSDAPRRCQMAWQLLKVRRRQGEDAHIQCSGHRWCGGKELSGVDFTGGENSMTVIHIYKENESLFLNAIFLAGVSLVTLTAHFMTSAVSSETTRSTHLRLGSLSLRICFLTIASKARSGVKSPVLRGHWVD